MTDEERAGCCLFARFMPRRSWDFSSLHRTGLFQLSKVRENNLASYGSVSYLIKRTESPAKSLFVLTKTLQPVVSRCLFGWPAINTLCNFNVLLYLPSIIQPIKISNASSSFGTMDLKENNNRLYTSRQNVRERRRGWMCWRDPYHDKYAWMSTNCRVSL